MQKISLLIIASLVFSFSYAQPAVGGNAKEISLPNAAGKTISLSSLKGKMVLIDFWASWCGPCRRTVPSLKKIYSAFHSKGFEVYSISLDNDANDWKLAMKEDKISWPSVLDIKGDYAGSWEVNFIPNTFLLDTKGKILAINPSHQELEKMLKDGLK